ncbi:MAG: hypothetical protein AAGE52_38605 [Myxococcota bacterium]
MNTETRLAIGVVRLTGVLMEIFPLEVAEDCARNTAAAVLGGTPFWVCLKACVARRGAELLRTQDGVDPLDVYVRAGVAWLETTTMCDGTFHMRLMLEGAGFPEPLVDRGMRIFQQEEAA